MFGSIGGPELLVILVVALLVFGPRKIPELSRMIGKGLAEFRKATGDFKTALERDIVSEETPAPLQPPTKSEPTVAPTSGEPTPPTGSTDPSETE